MEKNIKSRSRLIPISAGSEFYRYILKTAPLGVILINKNFEITWLNDKIIEWLGLARPQLLNKSLEEVITDKETFADIFLSTSSNSPHKSFQVRLKNKKNQVVFCRLEIAPFPESETTICYLENITELILAQESLREKNRIKKLTNQVGETLSRKLKVEDICESLVSFTSEILNADIASIFYHDQFDNKYVHLYTCGPESRINHEGLVLNVIDDQVAIMMIDGKDSLPIRMFRSESIIQTIPYGITAPNGELLGIMFLGFKTYTNHSDHTHLIKEISNWASIAIENARLYERVCNEEENLRKITESIPQMIWTANEAGKLDYFNEQWEFYTGLSFNLILGTGWLRCIHPDDLKRTLKSWYKSVKHGNKFETEYRLKRSDGNFRWHLVRAIPLKDRQNNIYKWVGTSTDIDSQKRMDERKNDFISIASHELKTPLTSLKAYIQLLQQTIDSINPADLKKYIGKTSVYIDKLNGLITNLLDLSRIQGGKLAVDMEPFDLDQLIEDCVENFRHSIKSHKIIKHKSKSVWIIGDKQRIEQVICNYITNAIKYSPNGDVVEIKSIIKDQKALIRVRDYGMGIPKEKLHKVFDRFYRVSNSQKIEGLGIGLYISQEILKLHGGRTWAESDEGIGTDFFIEIPVMAEDSIAMI